VTIQTHKYEIMIRKAPHINIRIIESCLVVYDPSQNYKRIMKFDKKNDG